MKVLDLTHVITPEMPVFPGTEPPVFEPANTIEKDGFRETKLTFYTHTGTHVDPPAHIVPDGKTLDRFPPEQFLGKALVIDCRALREGEPITPSCLAPYGDKVEKADFLLFCLGWDRRWGSDAYFGDFPCIDDAVLDLILKGSYKGVGFDVISVDPVRGDCLGRHKKLFREKEILNIENLCNLDKCGSDLFWFGCFPLKLQNCDGAPVRALAWFED